MAKGQICPVCGKHTIKQHNDKLEQGSYAYEKDGNLIIMT